ncbi:MAG: hypothetical protein HY299_11700 [Verrucomicrobia bacterium]|nr:hypothetical protein [Verrucomicrobiota bacterium]
MTAPLPKYKPLAGALTWEFCGHPDEEKRGSWALPSLAESDRLTHGPRDAPCLKFWWNKVRLLVPFLDIHEAVFRRHYT